MAVVTLEITSRQPLAGGRSFGNVGPYVQLDGTAHFAVDPNHPANRCITDIDLAPRSGDGRVQFEADVRILVPEDPRHGNQRLFLDVPNRGNRLALTTFNLTPRPMVPSAPLDPGDGFLMRRGYTVVWCGWQHDVPAVNGLMRIRVPEAQSEGSPVSGPVMVKFQPNSPGRVQLLSDRLHRPYPSNNLDNTGATLLVRAVPDAEPREIPREQWRFAKLDAGQVVPDPSHIYLASGFEPGKLYQLIYTTTGAPVIGLGLLATRDIVAFLRHGRVQAGNPCAADIKQAYAFGASQSGRFLRQFLYLGLNEDEEERMVFDGVLAHIAGGKRGGDFNQRFGQPSSTLYPSLSDLFPFHDVTQTDPATGRRDGLLAKLAERKQLPKIFFTNSSAEYWRGDASLTHTNVAGTEDLPHSASVRIYHFAGTQHSAGVLPLTDTNPLDGARGQKTFNCVDYRPLLRAALVRLDRWVTAHEEPPESRYPRLFEGTTVAPERLADVYKAIPGLRFPTHLPRTVALDFGPMAEKGIVTRLPPVAGKPYLRYVPAVDQDGNELSGIRLPDLSVPLATCLGWNLRHPDMGADDQLMPMMGATVPFPATRQEREARGDPRLSIAERYFDKAEYLRRVRHAVQALVADGHVLAEDLELLVEAALQRYELFAETLPATTARA